MDPYVPTPTGYDKSRGWFRKCGRSGLYLPAISLGCWQNFGDPGSDSGRTSDEGVFHENVRSMLFTAFDHGVTHFDLANNYGPVAGAAEKRVGRVLNEDLKAYRDELIISTKAGYGMWPGPYGDGGRRRKSLLYQRGIIDDQCDTCYTNYLSDAQGLSPNLFLVQGHGL
jgi:L-glyceraldehyde 3-phosphate reductase